MFYKSKKFQYAAVSFLTAFVVSLVPNLIDMTQVQMDQMYTLAKVVLLLGFTVIGGHQWMDVKSIELLKPGEALDKLLEAMEAPPREIDPTHLQKFSKPE